jgi:hypothetical protein
LRPRRQLIFQRSIGRTIRPIVHHIPGDHHIFTVFLSAATAILILVSSTVFEAPLHGLLMIRQSLKNVCIVNPACQVSELNDIRSRLPSNNIRLPQHGCRLTALVNPILTAKW